MIFDVCNLSDKITSDLYLPGRATGKYNVNHCCLNQKVIVLGNQAT